MNRDPKQVLTEWLVLAAVLGLVFTGFPFVITIAPSTHGRARFGVRAKLPSCRRRNRDGQIAILHENVGILRRERSEASEHGIATIRVERGPQIDRMSADNDDPLREDGIEVLWPGCLRHGRDGGN